ncbi:MAG TPA: NADH-quinone oxidoreductase subunit J [Methylibium sp.]|uniref:NADH-quinone oxidoreductase subunit J n=1 Tax=Methylibium sp. TaxID=2067992 RepID=UPI002DB79218|nr:NADH-quinone oxidoreductase subunit J [Methylibium sp.]HEU4459675.1 NADH-quinone oxidoreductase subunit J [Methylibium sp.]
MNTEAALFYVFSAILLFASFRVITAKTTVYAALYLVLAFFTAACVWMLLRAEFLAISLVLVYVGAVMVLFLFVVMMLDANMQSMDREGFWKLLPVGGSIGAVIAVEMIWVLKRGFDLPEAPPPDVAEVALGNTKLLGIEIYTQYLYPLQIAAVLLLVAIIAAIALTMRKRKDSKFLDPAAQIRVRKADRVRIVSMAAERAPEPPAPVASDTAAKPGGAA